MFVNNQSRETAFTVKQEDALAGQSKSPKRRVDHEGGWEREHWG